MQTPSIEQLKQGDLPVVVADHEGNIVDVNSHFETVFGWSAQEIIGQSITVILPPFFHDSHNLGFARFSATGESTVLNHPLLLKAVTKNNQEIESEHFIIAEQQAGQWLFAATLRPLESPQP
jgi:PAS domain-containing protein